MTIIETLKFCKVVLQSHPQVDTNGGASIEAEAIELIDQAINKL
jgi:hypothetical protein